jgi:histidyl-tRNA synthetase
MPISSNAATIERSEHSDDDARATAPEMDEGSMAERGLRSTGMRDLDPEEMRVFRRIERTFLDVAERGGYLEVRTPTIEPLHLYTAASALTPQLLDRVYSFLDWDGWSGERVVLRPDATVSVARFVAERGVEGPTRLSYVEPVYRFDPEAGDRQVWQCGLEAFGISPREGDAELLRLALALLEGLAVEDVSVELGHAGLARAIFAAVGLDAEERLDAYDRLLEGEDRVAEELAAAYPQAAAALRVLAAVDGSTAAYVDNLRATVLPVAPDAAGALDELRAAAVTLDEAGVRYRILPGTARNFEYYSGVTFRVNSGTATCVVGGRYDGLVEALGGTPTKASGFAADIVRLAALAGGAS